MRSAAKLFLIATLAGCGGGDEVNEPAIGNEVKATNETLANADIEALPADESVGTTSEELANGVNEPDAGEPVNQP